MSYHLVGASTPNSMRVAGQIGQRWVMVLVDTEATHNFLSLRVADELDIQRKEHPMFEVMVGDGSKLQSYFMYPDVKLEV